MQHRQNSISQKIILMLIGTAWVAGLLIAGSDSPYMPWTNTIGLILFLGASILLGRQLRHIDQKTIKMNISKTTRKEKSPVLRAFKKNQGMKIRYAVTG